MEIDVVRVPKGRNKILKEKKKGYGVYALQITLSLLWARVHTKVVKVGVRQHRASAKARLWLQLKQAEKVHSTYKRAEA